MFIEGEDFVSPEDMEARKTIDRNREVVDVLNAYGQIVWTMSDEDARKKVPTDVLEILAGITDKEVVGLASGAGVQLMNDAGLKNVFNKDSASIPQPKVPETVDNNLRDNSLIYYGEIRAKAQRLLNREPARHELN